MTDLINVIITAVQDKQPTEDEVNAILAQVQSYRCMGEYTLTGLHQRKARKAAQKAANSKAVNVTRVTGTGTAGSLGHPPA